MTSESALLRRIQIELSPRGYRLFRNSVGLGYVGTLVNETASNRIHREIIDGVEVYTEAESRRYITLANARPVKFGLAVGSPDLVGWKRVVITPEMVGKDVAVFVGIEGKTPRVRLTEDQENFLEQIARWGGYAAVARDGEDGIEYREVSL